ncbi:MAG: hypothetical protein J6X93_03275 [Bacilli bacterium]|nr:hypothetical protein [Bacilli bacterium]
MKKILLIILLFFSALFFVGCNVNEFKLIVNDDFGIIKNKLSGSYKAGEEVEVKIQFFSGLRAQVYLDEKELELTSIEAYEYESFVFTMPNHDAILQTTINGYTKPQKNVMTTNMKMVIVYIAAQKKPKMILQIIINS